MRLHVPSLRDAAVLLVNAVARLGEAAVMAWPRVTGGEDE